MGGSFVLRANFVYALREDALEHAAGLANADKGIAARDPRGGIAHHHHFLAGLFAGDFKPINRSEEDGRVGLPAHAK